MCAEKILVESSEYINHPKIELTIDSFTPSEPKPRQFLEQFASQYSSIFEVRGEWRITGTLDINGEKIPINILVSEVFDPARGRYEETWYYFQIDQFEQILNSGITPSAVISALILNTRGWKDTAGNEDGDKYQIGHIVSAQDLEIWLINDAMLKRFGCKAIVRDREDGLLGADLLEDIISYDADDDSYDVETYDTKGIGYEGQVIVQLPGIDPVYFNVLQDEHGILLEDKGKRFIVLMYRDINLGSIDEQSIKNAYNLAKTKWNNNFDIPFPALDLIFMESDALSYEEILRIIYASDFQSLNLANDEESLDNEFEDEDFEEEDDEIDIEEDSDEG